MTYYISRSFPLKQKTCLHVFMSKNMFSSLNAGSTWAIALVQHIIGNGVHKNRPLCIPATGLLHLSEKAR